MDEVKTVEDLIRAKELSAEEEVQLRDIIEECRAREIQIKEASLAARRNLEGLSRSFGLIIDTIAAVGSCVDELHAEVERLQLKMMPEELFGRE
jgi:hypothetical protein